LIVALALEVVESRELIAEPLSIGVG